MLPDLEEIGGEPAGRLVPLSGIAIELGHAYCLVHPRSKARKPGLQALIDWLTREREALQALSVAKGASSR